MKKIILVSAIAIALIGCNKEQKSEAKATSETAKSSAAVAPAVVDKELCKLNLKIAGLPNMTIDDQGEMMGCMITTDRFVLRGKTPGEFDPVTLEKAKKEAVETYNGEQLKAETFPHGYILTYHNKGEIGESWFLNACLTIGGKKYYFSTTQVAQSQQLAALEAIKTIH